MEMPEINYRIRQLVDKYANRSVKKFAESINIPQQTLNRLFNIDTRTQKYPLATTDMLVAISRRYPNIDTTWLLTGIGDSEKTNESSITIKEEFSLRTDHKVPIQKVPLYRITASAGILALFQDAGSSVPIGEIQIPNLPRCDGALYVFGASMQPILQSGDIVLYKQVEVSNILWGEMYLVAFDLDGDDYVAVKYIQKAEDPKMVTLVSLNSRYSPQDIPWNSIRALALVKASIRFNTIG